MGGPEGLVPSVAEGPKSDNSTALPAAVISKIVPLEPVLLQPWLPQTGLGYPPP
jgi:hypothetical protein